jgi:hypothetical protein
LYKLVGVVKKNEEGDYDRTVTVESRDEIGELADSVNSMARGLAEKEMFAICWARLSLIRPQCSYSIIQSSSAVRSELPLFYFLISEALPRSVKASLLKRC